MSIVRHWLFGTSLSVISLLPLLGTTTEQEEANLPRTTIARLTGMGVMSDAIIVASFIA
jgi:hypothetical protein